MAVASLWVYTSESPTLRLEEQDIELCFILNAALSYGTSVVMLTDRGMVNVVGAPFPSFLIAIHHVLAHFVILFFGGLDRISKVKYLLSIC